MSDFKPGDEVRITLKEQRPDEAWGETLEEYRERLASLEKWRGFRAIVDDVQDELDLGVTHLRPVNRRPDADDLRLGDDHADFYWTTEDLELVSD